MKRILFLIVFTITTLLVNAQSDCNVFLTSNFDSKCVLTDEKDNILIENGEAMLACKESVVEYYAISPDAVLYQWTIIGQSSYSTNGNTVTINWSNGNVGKVTVQITTSNGQTCDATKDIFLIEKPQIGSSSIPSYRWENGIKVIDICLGETVTFTNESATSNTDLIGHYWESIYSTASSENYTIENVMQDTKVYHKIINNCGCEDDEMYEIRIMGGEKLELSCYGTTCENTTVTYEALNGNCSDYNWFVEGGQIISGQHSPKITIQWGSPQCGYGVLGLDGGLCNNFCPKLMSVKIPIITNNAEIKGQITACVGEVALYSLTLWGSTEYTWTITPSIGVSQSHYDNANQTLLTFNSPGTYQLSATYKCDFLECGPFTSQTKTITIKPELKISSENENICLGQAATFTLNNTTISARWRVYNANNQQVYTTLTNSLTYTPTSSGKYRVTAEHADYCNVAEFLINVKNPPPAPTNAEITNGIVSVCPNSSIILNGTPSSPLYSLIWEPTTTAGTPTEVGGNKATITFGSNICDVNVYHYDKELGCRSAAYVQQIQLFTLANVNLPQTTQACAGSVMEFMNNEVPNQSPNVLYEWTVIPQNAATIEGSKISNNVKLLVNDLGNGSTFTIKLKRTYCTSSFDDYAITVTEVSPPTSAPSISSPTSDCINSSVAFSLSSTPTGAVSNQFSWKIDNGITYSNAFSISHAFGTSGNHLVELIYQPYSYCPSVSSSTTINIENPPPFEYLRGNGGTGTTIDVFPPIPTDGSYNFYWTYNGTYLAAYSAGGNPLLCPTSGCASIPFLGNGEYCCNVISNSANACSVEHCITIPSSSSGGTTPPCYNLPISLNSNTLCTDQKIILQATNPTTNTITWAINPSRGVIPPTTNPGEFHFNSVGDYTIIGSVTDGNNCYTGYYNITLSCILKLELEYDCVNHKVIIHDKSEYLNPANVGQRTCTLTGGGQNQTLTIPAGYFDKESNVISLPTTATTYTVTISYDNCQKSKTITLSPPFTSMTIATNLSSLSPFNSCENNPIQLQVTTLPTGSSNTINKIHWNFGDGSTVDATGNTVYHTFPYVNSNPYLVTATITDANNCSNIAGAISIIPHTDDFASGTLYPYSAKVCEGSARQIRFTPQTANSYQWYAPLNQTTTYYANNVFHTGDYTVLATNNNGCIKEAMANVGFNNSPTAAILCKTDYCQGDKIDLNGELGIEQGVTYDWQVDAPNGVSTNYTDPKISFTASLAGTYNIQLIVYEGTCWDITTTSIEVHQNPVAPSISFVGNQCIDQPPVVLGATAPNGESIYWSSGIHNPTADYYSPGYALAYYYEQTSGCKSQNANILIPSAPNFDALLTGCYKKCKYLLPSSLNVYNISKDYISWKWFFNSSSTTGSGNYLFSPLTLPLSGFGTYNLNVTYNNNNCSVTSPSLVIEQEDCPCEKVDLKVTPKQHIEDCRIIYEVDVTICNNGSNTACFDDLSSLISGINILGTNNFPLTVAPGDCKTFNFKFEVTDPLVSFAEFQLYDKCNKCYKEFTVDINVEIVDCEKEIVIKDLKYNTDVSNENVSYFNFSLYLPSNPQAIFRVWTEPYQVIDYVYDPSSSIIDGLAMFDYGVLTQMAENGEKVCFHVLMCQDNIIHECVICIDANELLEMIGNKSISSKPKPTDNEKQTSQTDKLYLVPNPADTYVKVEGIEQDNVSELLLIDMTGKNLKKVQATNTLDIQDVLKGTYILRVINKENKVYYLKLIKN